MYYKIGWINAEGEYTQKYKDAFQSMLEDQNADEMKKRAEKEKLRLKKIEKDKKK